MANKPCIGSYTCPYCKAKTIVLWNGNKKDRCIVCKKLFKVHRQKMFNIEHVNATILTD